jgi:hypothetical protein
VKGKYVVFKDDDVGKDFDGLKKWIEIILENEAKAAIGLIGKYLKNDNLVAYLKSLDSDNIEIFCHGFTHSQLPYLTNKLLKRNRKPKTEFNKDYKSHFSSLKKYRAVESRYLNTKAIAFGPQGNIRNKNVIKPLLKNDFKLMFAWEKVGGGVFTIPLSDNLKQNTLDEFKKDYEKHKNDVVYTLQFHHANLSEEQFGLMSEVIGFLSKEEGRVFVTPSELLKINEKESILF